MLSLPLHIICIQSPYDMYPSMIVRENSHVKRARSQQHTDIDPYQLLWSISTLIATRSSTIYMHGMHPTNWCLHKRVCILFSILHMSHSSVCMVYHSIPVSTRIQHDPRSSYTSVTCLWAHVWWYWRSFELRSAFVHMMCTFTRFEYIMYHKTSTTKTTHVHTSYQVTLVCIMLCQSIRMCLWRVDFRYPSSNFGIHIECQGMLQLYPLVMDNGVIIDTLVSL